MPSEINPKARANEIIVQELEKELLIYDLENHKVYSLNETSALVWQMCDGNKSISEISQLIAKKLKSTVDEDFVWLAIDQLKKENLLGNSGEVVVDFKGLSRRDVIRKIGLASIIALPAISKLVAPTAAMAQSIGGCVNPTGAAPGTPLGITFGSSCVAFIANSTCGVFAFQCCSGMAKSNSCVFDSELNLALVGCECV